MEMVYGMYVGRRVIVVADDVDERRDAMRIVPSFIIQLGTRREEDKAASAGVRHPRPSFAPLSQLSRLVAESRLTIRLR